MSIFITNKTDLKLVLPEEALEPLDTDDNTDRGDKHEFRLDDITEFKPINHERIEEKIICIYYNNLTFVRLITLK